ncbi:uncharacterized protein LOC134189679 [Corticium candelabrum]|uniref:uncharacterized protein LOC134189679 n=1 Tax=Corticium candelabrum TaxID=121492 RepID=UPI002E26075B|nr:uncharacterized protein LOC134189679 [Corticium candelabrum]
MGVIAGISTINQGQLSAAEDAPPIAQDLWKRITKCGNQYKLREIVPGCYITLKSTFTLPAEFRETVNAFFSSRNIPDIQADEKVAVHKIFINDHMVYGRLYKRVKKRM